VTIRHPERLVKDLSHPKDGRVTCLRLAFARDSSATPQNDIFIFKCYN